MQVSSSPCGLPITITGSPIIRSPSRASLTAVSGRPGLDFQQRQIVLANHGQQFRRQLPAVAERYLVEERPLHGMGVRENVARLMDDEAAAQARHLTSRQHEELFDGRLARTDHRPGQINDGVLVALEDLDRGRSPRIGRASGSKRLFGPTGGGKRHDRDT